MENFLFRKEYAEEESQFKDFRSLIESIQSEGATSSSETEFYSTLCSHADHILETIQRHFHNEEVRVIIHLSWNNFSKELLRWDVYVLGNALLNVDITIGWLINWFGGREFLSYVQKLHHCLSKVDNYEHLWHRKGSSVLLNPKLAYIARISQNNSLFKLLVNVFFQCT